MGAIGEPSHRAEVRDLTTDGRFGGVCRVVRPQGVHHQRDEKNVEVSEALIAGKKYDFDELIDDLPSARNHHDSD